MMHKPVRRIADGPPPWPPRRPAPWLLPLALAVLALGHCVSNEFAPDDERYVLRNPGVHSLGNLPSFFGLEYWGRDQATTIRSYVTEAIVERARADNVTRMFEPGRKRSSDPPR